MKVYMFPFLQMFLFVSTEKRIMGCVFAEKISEVHIYMTYLCVCVCVCV